MPLLTPEGVTSEPYLPDVFPVPDYMYDEDNDNPLHQGENIELMVQHVHRP